VNLSEHFTLAEFCRSDMAVRRNIPNNLPADLLNAAKATAAMMEGIRAHLCKLAGREIRINVSSGYRCIQLNRTIGSSDRSDHVQAAAMDWEAPGFGTPTAICQALAPLVGILGIGQLINEYPDRDGWVHTSTRLPAKAVNRVITITGRGTSVGILEG
jgi:zinc D-Ala-D-Ala carboxypeptidase